MVPLLYKNGSQNDKIDLFQSVYSRIVLSLILHNLHTRCRVKWGQFQICFSKSKFCISVSFSVISKDSSAQQIDDAVNKKMPMMMLMSQDNRGGPQLVAIPSEIMLKYNSYAFFMRAKTRSFEQLARPLMVRMRYVSFMKNVFLTHHPNGSFAIFFS